MLERSFVVQVTLDTCVQTSLPKVITVKPVPVGTLTPNQTICQGQGVTLTATGGTTYNWSAPGASGNKLTIAPNTTTTYSVTITNAEGCSDIKSATINVNPSPLSTISAAGSTTLCDGQSVNLNASGGTGYTFQWCLNSQPISGQTNQTLTATLPGAYQVITMLNGCSRESSPTFITVNPLPTPTITPNDTICSGDSLTLMAGGGVSYQWNSGGPASPNYRVAPTTSKTYTVTVTSSDGCTQTASTTITVKPLPNASISMSGPAMLCSGQSVNLNASAGTGYTYQWYKNLAILNGQTASALAVNAAGSYHVIVTVDGCSRTSAPQAITVNPVPTPVVSPGVTICQGDSTTLTASGGTGYQWSSGGPATATYRVAPASTKTYTVTVSNSFGCTASGSVVVTVTPLPQVWITAAGSTTLCSGQAVTLSSQNTAGYSYKWYRNNTLISGATTSNYSASTAGTYHVINTVSGCVDTSTNISITVNPLPVTTISHDTTVCSGDTVTLSAAGGISYAWNTGPLTQSIVVSNTSTRTYTVTITDGNNCSVQRSVTVTATALPNASVSLSGPATFCADRTLTLTASTGTGYVYQWIKNNAIIPGATNSTYLATQNGSYQVKVTANGCNRKSTNTVVTVNPLPIAVASNDTTVCSADTAQLHASGGTSYQWFNGSTNPTISVAPTNTTTYGVTVTNNFGCSATESVVVSTIARPTAIITPVGSVAICNGQTTTLTASAGTGYSYQWLEGASTLNGQTNSTYNTPLSGNYSVIVTANGCPKRSNTVAVTVNPLPVAVVSYDTTVCSGSPLTLSANGGNAYKWSTGATTQSINVTPANTTTYNVTVTSAQNCSVTANVFVSTIPSPTANVTTSGISTLCLGDTVTLTASSGPLYAYQWKKDGNDISNETNISYYATTPGAYTVVVSALGCSKTSSPTNVIVNPLPIATASNDTTVCQGSTVDLIAYGGTSFHWSNGRFTQTNSVFPNATANYTVTVTDNNGCTASEAVTVNIIPLPTANLTAGGSLNLCSGQTVTLNVSSAAGNSYQWKLDGNPVSGANTSTYSASVAGAYTAVVTQNGCSKTSLPITVNVNPSLQATASNDTTICSGDTISLFAAGGATYAWSTGDTVPSFTVVPTSSKTYMVTVSNGTTCTDVEMITVTVKTRPTAFVTVSAGVSAICAGQTATLNGNTGTGLTYQWYNNDNPIPDADSSKYITGDSGSYTLQVSLNGCSRTSSPKHIAVNPLPVVHLSNDTTICSESPVTLIVSGGVSYVWNTFITDSIYTITTSTPKTYAVTVTNASGCKASDQVVVNTLALPTNVTISTHSSTSICEGSAVELIAGPSNGTEYQWLRDGVDISGANTALYDASEDGDYAIIITGNGCSKRSSPQHVTVKPTPDTPEIIGLPFDSLMCTVVGDNYKWFRGGLTFSVGHQKVKASKSGIYTVFVSLNNCPSDTSAPFVFYVTGVEAADASDLVIYPNPTEGSFTLTLPAQTIHTPIEIFNTIGEKVLEVPDVIGKTNVQIDLSGLPQGIFYLRVAELTKKVVLTR